MNPALLSAIILGGALLLFISEKVRHDLVALLALFACLIAGLVEPSTAFSGFADPAVLAVAAVLVVGRAVELSGAASAIARVAIPSRAGFGIRSAMLLVVAAVLSAFMNNIAALVITMPIASEIARDAKRPPGAILMPLAFATILGGMTTLIGTPANLILSSVRESELGEPFGFFTMTPVGGAVMLIGIAYLALIGWRLLPVRQSLTQEQRNPWRVFELTPPDEGMTIEGVKQALRESKARMIAAFRFGSPLPFGEGDVARAGDRLLVTSRSDSATVAEKTGLIDPEQKEDEDGSVTAHVVVGHGSSLEGSGYNELRIRSDNRLRIVAAGPRAASEKLPLARLRIRPGDQLFVRGSRQALAEQLTSARLLEIDRLDPMPIRASRSAFIIAIFTLSILAIVVAEVSPALAFLAAAVILAASRSIPADEIYRSIDWSIIVLLGAMIPVGQSFEDSGAATIVAQWLGDTLAGQPLFLALAAICAATMLLSIFLNNVATAVIMGPLAIKVAALLGIAPDAALLAVLIGASSDFLTPIGHQNNLLVMGPGAYRFTDYIRMGAILVLLVVATSAFVLSTYY
ncbi:MAG: SLC13 family permease [Sphingobium sp.]